VLVHSILSQIKIINNSIKYTIIHIQWWYDEVGGLPITILYYIIWERIRYKNEKKKNNNNL